MHPPPDVWNSVRLIWNRYCKCRWRVKIIDAEEWFKDLNLITKYILWEILTYTTLQTSRKVQSVVPPCIIFLGSAKGRVIQTNQTYGSIMAKTFKFSPATNAWRCMKSQTFPASHMQSKKPCPPQKNIWSLSQDLHSTMVATQDTSGKNIYCIHDIYPSIGITYAKKIPSLSSWPTVRTLSALLPSRLLFSFILLCTSLLP